MKIREQTKKVLFFTEASAYGGAEKHTYLILKHLDKKLFEITFVCSDSPALDTFVNDIKDLGIKVLRYKQYNLNKVTLSNLKELRSIFKKNTSELIYLVFNTQYGNKVPIISLMTLRKTFKVIGSVELASDEYFNRKFYKQFIMYFWYRLFANYFDLFIAVAQQNVKVLNDTVLIPKKKIKVINNAIEINNNKVKNIKYELGYKDSDVIFATIARFSKQKGYRYIVEAIKKLDGKLKDAKFLFVGTGEEEESIKKLVKEYKLQDLIKFLGFRNDIDNILSSIDAYVLPSIHEGMPLGILEAMSYKLPIIATSVGGVEDEVINEVTGLVITPGNSEKLAKAIMQILENKEMREKMGSKGYEKLIDEFDIKKSVKKLQKEMLDILKL